MRVVRIFVGVLVAFVGALWTLQGLGSEFVPRSFMTNSVWWVVVGPATIVAGSLVIIAAKRRG